MIRSQFLEEKDLPKTGSLKLENVTSSNGETITMDGVNYIVKKTKNWKAWRKGSKVAQEYLLYSQIPQ